MSAAQKQSWRQRLASTLNTGIVLSSLVGIGWWGHHTHWQLPSMSAHEVDSSSDVSAPASTATIDESVSTAASVLPFPDGLPEITFESAEGARKCGIETGFVTQRAMDDQIQANGVTAYDQTRLAQLSSRVPGSVYQVLKRVGDSVQAGDILALVDSADVGAAKASLLEASLNYQLKSRHFDRITKVKDVVPGKELVEIEASCQLAQTQRSTALQKLINLGFRISRREIEGLSADELEVFLHRLGLPDGMKVETQSDNLIPIVAPFSGVVTECEVVQGENVEPAKMLYVIADITRMWIHLNVRQDDANRLQLGSVVEFTADRNTAPLLGKLTWIGTAIDPRTRTIQARAEIDRKLATAKSAEIPPHQPTLSAGLYGSARILSHNDPTAIVIPNSSLYWQWELSQEVVFIVDDDDGRSFRPQIVTKGLSRDGIVQVLNGLQPGDRIVTRGTRILSAELSEKLLQLSVGQTDARRSFHHVSVTN